MFDDPIKFYLVRERQVGNLKEEFDQIFTYLATYGDIGLERKNESTVTISYPETSAVSTLATSVDPTAKDTVSTQQITLTCERYDNFTVNVLKNITARIGYRIYNPQNNSYLVSDSALMDLTTIELDKKMLGIFKTYGFDPLYNYNNSKVYYAKSKKDSSIHLVNPHLLEFLLQEKSKTKKQKDFSVKVAENTGKFIALVDRGLIPLDFYKTYFNPSLVFNLSGFSVNQLKQSLYIMPVFFKFEPKKQNFIQLNEHKFTFSPIKLPKGASFEKEIKTLVRKINIDEKVMTIKVARQVDYKRGKTAALTPLLRVSVFLEN